MAAGASQTNVTGDLTYDINLQRVSSQGVKFWATIELLSWDPMRTAPERHNGFTNGKCWVNQHGDGAISHNSAGHLKKKVDGSLLNWNVEFNATDNEKAVTLKVEGLSLVGEEDTTVYVAKLKVASWSSESAAENGVGTRLDDDMQIFYLMSKVDDQYYLQFSPCADLEKNTQPWSALDVEDDNRFPCSAGPTVHPSTNKVGVAPYCDKYHLKNVEYLEIISTDWQNINKPAVGDVFKSDLNYLVEAPDRENGKKLASDQYTPFRECYTCTDRLSKAEFDQIVTDRGLTQPIFDMDASGGNSVENGECIAINPKRNNGHMLVKLGRYVCGSKGAPTGAGSTNHCIGTISMDEYHISEALMNTLTSLGWGEGIGGFKATAFETTTDLLTSDPSGAPYAKTVKWKRMIGHGHTRVHRASLPGTASSYSWRGGVEFQPEDTEDLPVVDNASFYWIINSTASQSYEFFDRYRQQIEIEVNKVANLDGSGEELRYDIVRAWDPEHKKMFIESTYRNQASVTVGGKINEVFDVGVTLALSRSSKDGLDGEGNQTINQTTNVTCRAYMTWTDLLSNAIKGDPDAEGKFAWSDALSVSIDLGSAGGSYTKKWSYFVKDDDGSVRRASAQERAFRKDQIDNGGDPDSNSPILFMEQETEANSHWKDSLFEVQAITVNYDIKSNNGWLISTSLTRDANGNIETDAAVTFTADIPSWENVKFSLDWTLGKQAPNLSLAYRSPDLLKKLAGLQTPTIAGKQITLFLNSGINVNEALANKEYMPSWSFEGTWGNPGDSILSGFRYDLNIPEGKLAVGNSTNIWSHEPTESAKYKAQVSWAMEAKIGDPTRPFYTAPVDAAGIDIGLDATFEKTVIEFNDMWGKMILRANFTAGLKAGTSTVGGGGLGGGMANAGVFGICGLTWDNNVLGYLKFPVNMVPSVGPKFGWNFVLKAISTAGGAYTGASFIMLLGGVNWNIKPVDQLRQHLSQVRDPWVEDIPLLGPLLSTLPIIGAIGTLESELQYMARAGTARAFAALGAAGAACIEVKKKAFLAVWQAIVSNQRSRNFNDPCCWADGIKEVWDKAKKEGDPDVLKIVIPEDFFTTTIPSSAGTHRQSTASMEWARLPKEKTKDWFTGEGKDPFKNVTTYGSHSEITISEKDINAQKYLGGSMWKLLTNEASTKYPDCRLAAGNPWRTGGAKKNEMWGGKKSKCGRWEYDKREWQRKNPPCNCLRTQFDILCKNKHYQLHDLQNFPELDGNVGYISAILETVDDFVYNRVVNNCHEAGSTTKTVKSPVKNRRTRGKYVGPQGGQEGDTLLTHSDFYNTVYDMCAKSVSDKNDCPELEGMRSRLGVEGGAVGMNSTGQAGAKPLDDGDDEGQFVEDTSGVMTTVALNKLPAKNNQGKSNDPNGKWRGGGGKARYKDPNDNAFHDYSDEKFRDALADEIAATWEALDNDTWKHLGADITKVKHNDQAPPNDPDGDLTTAGKTESSQGSQGNAGRLTDSGSGDPRIVGGNDAKRELFERDSQRDGADCLCSPPEGIGTWGIWPWNWGKADWRPPVNPDANCMKKCIKEIISSDQPHRGDLLGIVFGYLSNAIKLGKPYCCNLEPLRTDDPKNTERVNCQSLYESYEKWKAKYELDIDRWWGLTNCPQVDDTGECVDCLPDFDGSPTVTISGSVKNKGGDDVGGGLCCSTRTYYKMWRYVFSFGKKVTNKIAAANTELDIIPIPHRWRDGDDYLGANESARATMTPGCTQVGLYGRDPEGRELTDQGFYHQPDGADNVWEKEDYSLNPERIECLSCPKQDAAGKQLKAKMGTLTAPVEDDGKPKIVGPEISVGDDLWAPNAHDDWLAYQTELDDKGKSSGVDWDGTGGRKIAGPSHYFKHDDSICDDADTDDDVYLPSYEDNNKRLTVLKYKVKASNKDISYVLTSPEFHIVNDYAGGVISLDAGEPIVDPSILNWFTNVSSVGNYKFWRFTRGGWIAPTDDTLDDKVAPHWMWDLEGGTPDNPAFENLDEAARAWASVSARLYDMGKSMKSTSPSYSSDPADIGKIFGQSFDLAHDFYKRINSSSTKSSSPNYPNAKKFTALLKSDEKKAKYWADMSLQVLKYDAEILIEAVRRMYLVWLSYWWGAKRQKDITWNEGWTGSQGGMSGGTSLGATDPDNQCVGGWYIYKMMDAPWNAGAKFSGDTSGYSGANFPVDGRYWLYVQENGMTKWALTGDDKTSLHGNNAEAEAHAMEMAGFFGWNNLLPANGGQKGKDGIWADSDTSQMSTLSKNGCCPWGAKGTVTDGCRIYNRTNLLGNAPRNSDIHAGATPVTARVNYDGDLLHYWNPLMDAIAPESTLTTSMIGTKETNALGATYELATEAIEASWRFSPSHTHGHKCGGKDTPLGRYNLAPFGWKLCGMFGFSKAWNAPETVARALKRHLLPYFGKRATPNTISSNQTDCGHGSHSGTCASDASPFRIPIKFILSGNIGDLESFYSNTAQGWNIESDYEVIKKLQNDKQFIPRTRPFFDNPISNTRKRLKRLRIFLATIKEENCNVSTDGHLQGLDLLHQLFTNNNFGLGGGGIATENDFNGGIIDDTTGEAWGFSFDRPLGESGTRPMTSTHWDWYKNGVGLGGVYSGNLFGQNGGKTLTKYWNGSGASTKVDKSDLYKQCITGEKGWGIFFTCGCSPLRLYDNAPTAGNRKMFWYTAGGWAGGTLNQVLWSPIAGKYMKQWNKMQYLSKPLKARMQNTAYYTGTIYAAGFHASHRHCNCTTKWGNHKKLNLSSTEVINLYKLLKSGHRPLFYPTTCYGQGNRTKMTDQCLTTESAANNCSFTNTQSHGNIASSAHSGIGPQSNPGGGKTGARGVDRYATNKVSPCGGAQRSTATSINNPNDCKCSN